MQTNRKIRTCVLLFNDAIIAVFDQRYIWVPSNFSNGLRFAHAELEPVHSCDVTYHHSVDYSVLKGDEQIGWCAWEDAFYAKWRESKHDIKAQCFVDYWGQHEQVQS